MSDFSFLDNRDRFRYLWDNGIANFIVNKIEKTNWKLVVIFFTLYNFKLTNIKSVFWRIYGAINYLNTREYVLRTKIQNKL